MPRSLRLMFTPLPSNADGPRLVFDGARVGFGVMGGGLSKASLDSPTPATLSLKMLFLDRARAPQDTEERALATLAGSVVFREDDVPVFSGNASGWVMDPAANDDAPDGATSTRALRVELASPDFEGSVSSQDLVVKLDPARFRFLEVRAKLEIGGDTEADFETNDVLDIMITANNPPPLGATIGVHPPLFDEIPVGAKLIVTPSDGDPISFELASGVDRGDGLLSFIVPDPQPGVLYTAEMQLLPSDSPMRLFQDFELNKLVTESNGASPEPLANLGADVLVFEAPPTAVDDTDAVQGGPDEPSDEQLASFDAQSGKVAVA